MQCCISVYKYRHIWLRRSFGSDSVFFVEEPIIHVPSGGISLIITPFVVETYHVSKLPDTSSPQSLFNQQLFDHFRQHSGTSVIPRMRELSFYLSLNNVHNRIVDGAFCIHGSLCVRCSFTYVFVYFLCCVFDSFFCPFIKPINLTARASVICYFVSPLYIYNLYQTHYNCLQRI